MKKKSLFGFNAKLALMLVAICGLFASCYEKEELTPADPTTPAAPAEYVIQGRVTDAESGLPLEGVNVSTDGASTQTKAGGAYSMKVSEGEKIVVFTLNGYTSESAPVYVAKLTEGVGIYDVNVAMYSQKQDPTYKTPKYCVTGYAKDAAGTNVTITDVELVNFNATATISGNQFSFDTEKAGVYYAVIKANGYTTTYATINISEVQPQEGTGEQKVEVSILVIMQKEAEVPNYFVSGILSYENGQPVANTALTLTVNGEDKRATTNQYGYYSFDLGNVSDIQDGTLAVLTIHAESDIKKAFLLRVTSADKTNIYDPAIVLTTPENGTNGGGSIDMPIENATETTLDDLDEALLEKIQNAANTHGINLGENVISVTVENALPMEIISVEANDGVSTTMTDQVTLPAGSVFYLNEQAENITLTRDMATEKATTSLRTFVGTPTGTVFENPLEIKFQSSIALDEVPDFVLNTLYLKAEGNWVEEGDKVAVYDETSKSFIGEIDHFSTFRFGFVTASKDTEITPLEPIIINKPCYTGAYEAIVTLKGSYDGGTAYDGNTLQLAVSSQLQMNRSSQAFVTTMYERLIKLDYNNLLPANNYTKTDISYDIQVPANKQIANFSLTRNEIKKTYTMTVTGLTGSKTQVVVTIKRIVSAEITPNYVEKHDHGHGDDLNAGGGIIEFE